MKKKLEIFVFSSGKCRTVPKNVKGDPLGFINIHSVAKYQKTCRGTLWGHLKIFEKKSHRAEKIQRADALGTSGFVGFLEKEKRGPFTLIRFYRLRLKSKKPKGGPFGIT